jgi:DNA-binding NtrC family response regulator
MNASVDPILLVEDTPSLSMVYETVLKKAGNEVICAATAAAARRAFHKHRSPIVLLDLMLPDGDGIDLLHEMKREASDTKVIVITANGSINRAVEAMRGGAFDFLVKPFDDRRLTSAVENARATANVAAPQASPPEKRAGKTAEYQGFRGGSDQMREIYAMVENIGRSTATVFVTGESGTGKEVCAQAVHKVSNRRSGPFIPLNCGAIPKDLLESEVFGHLKGSFTGAISDKQGAAAAADGGTLFMDEICEMPLALQTKLLRFLQTSMIQPVGAVTPRKVDVRIVCATNRDPVEEVRAGRFREDLFYRLHVVPIHLPPLRERGEDVIEIAETFLADFSREESKAFTGLSDEVKAIFRAHPWPGNVRQLQNTLRNVVVLYEGQTIEVEMLPADLMRQMALAKALPASSGGEAARAPHLATPAQEEDNLAAHARRLVGASLADVEREFIEATIAECGGSITKAARLLDVSPSTLYRKRDAWSKSSGGTRVG